MRLMVEMRLASKDALTRLRKLGASEIPGFKPVTMQSAGGPTVIYTVTVPDQATEQRIRNLRGVVGVFGDPQVEPLSSK